MLRQLTDQDASFLYVETAETPAHVGGLSLVELPAGYRGDFYATYKALVASRLRHVPFLHSKLAPVPFDLDRPFWVEDEAFDIDHHVRHVTAPRPGGMAELEALVGLLHGTLLDRSRPLWEFYVIDGLASGHAAIYTKIHHAAMDGASSMALISTVYDPTPEVRVLPPAPADDGSQRATFANMVEGLLAHLVRQEIQALQYIPDLMRAWSHLALPDASTLRRTRIAAVPRTPHTLLNVGITNQRAYAARTLRLADVKRVAKQTGTKINDVVLAVCGGALRSYLGAKGALPEQSLTALVPISLHHAGDDRANHNGMFSCALATDVADARQRLLAIHASSQEQRQRFELMNTIPVPDVTVPGASYIVPQLVALYGVTELARRVPLFGNLVVSNVPGPTAPLYVAGAKIASMFPCSIPFHGAALNITVQSYCDRLDFGLIACRRALPDLARLADGLVASFAELDQGGQTHDDPHHRTPPDRTDREAAAEAGPARDARAAEAAGDRYPEAARQRPEGHRSAAVGQ